MDTQRLIATYTRYYPLFQEAYESLGHPPQYFNDRLIEVIDHLLETPDLQGPIALAQPNVLYEFADPALESRSAGQKALIRMGSENATAVKDKLRELRSELIAKQPGGLSGRFPLPIQQVRAGHKGRRKTAFCLSLPLCPRPDRTHGRRQWIVAPRKFLPANFRNPRDQSSEVSLSLFACHQRAAMHLHIGIGQRPARRGIGIRSPRRHERHLHRRLGGWKRGCLARQRRSVYEHRLHDCGWHASCDRPVRGSGAC